MFASHCHEFFFRVDNVGISEEELLGFVNRFLALESCFELIADVFLEAVLDSFVVLIALNIVLADWRHVHMVN